MFKDRYNSSESVAGDPDRDWACYSERGRHRRQTRSSYLSLHLVTPPQARRRCATSSRGCAASSGTARATPGTSSTSRASATAWRNRRDSRRQPAARVSRRCPAARAASCTSGPSSNWLDSHKRWSREGGPVTGVRTPQDLVAGDRVVGRAQPHQHDVALGGERGSHEVGRRGRRGNVRRLTHHQGPCLGPRPAPGAVLVFPVVIPGPHLHVELGPLRQPVQSQRGRGAGRVGGWERYSDLAPLGAVLMSTFSDFVRLTVQRKCPFGWSLMVDDAAPWRPGWAAGADVPPDGVA